MLKVGIEPIRRVKRLLLRVSVQVLVENRWVGGAWSLPERVTDGKGIKDILRAEFGFAACLHPQVAQFLHVAKWGIDLCISPTLQWNVQWVSIAATRADSNDNTILCHNSRRFGG